MSLPHPFPTRRAAAIVAIAVFAVTGCGSDDSSDEASSDTTEAPADATTTEATTTTTSAPPGAPSEPLAPTTPEWTEACKVGDELIVKAWDLKNGTSTDQTGVAVSMLQMIDKIPPGTADAEITFVKDVINAFVGGEDLAPFQAQFRTNADALLEKVATGCGEAAGDGLPLPEDAIGEIESFLFPDA